MADETPRYRHIVVGHPRREAFTSPGKGPKRPEIPAQDRPSHGASLRQQLHAIVAVAPVDEEPEVPGLNVEFESFPDVDLPFESVSRERSGLDLRNVRPRGPRTLASANQVAIGSSARGLMTPARALGLPPPGRSPAADLTWHAHRRASHSLGKTRRTGSHGRRC